MGIYGDTNQCLWQTEEPIFPLAKEISTSDMPATLRGEKKKKKKWDRNSQTNTYTHTKKKKHTPQTLNRILCPATSSLIPSGAQL